MDDPDPPVGGKERTRHPSADQNRRGGTRKRRTHYPTPRAARASRVPTFSMPSGPPPARPLPRDRWAAIVLREVLAIVLPPRAHLLAAADDSRNSQRQTSLREARASPRTPAGGTPARPPAFFHPARRAISPAAVAATAALQPKLPTLGLPAIQGASPVPCLKSKKEGDRGTHPSAGAWGGSPTRGTRLPQRGMALRAPIVGHPSRAT